MKAVLIVSTYPERRQLSRIANELVRARLAACVNITPIRSVYSWKGKVENSAEYLAFFKTTTGMRRELRKRILETHPYEVPEIAELDMGSVSPPYLRWMAQSTSQKGTSILRSSRQARSP